MGHSLGLKHGQELGGPANVALPANVDSMEFSVMTYRSYIGQPLGGGYTNEQFGYAQTWMMLDIQALQYMYGADYNVNSGNTTYTWSQTTGQTFINGVLAIDPGANRIFATIWDGNGIDTYDLSNYTTNLQIDLNPGGWSTFSTTQLADLDQFTAGRLARGNIANALLFNNDTRSLIENAIGGSGNDSILGNQANNVLTGNAGNDTLNGGAGADTTNGGDGNDRIVDTDFVNFDVHNGGAGVDWIDYSGVTFSSGVVTINLATALVSVTAGNTETISNFENVDGSQGGETIIGNGAGNILYGNGGNDTIVAGGGEDTVRGGLGNDVLQGGFVTDYVYGEDGNDTIQVLAGEFYDNVDGGAGTDTLDHSASKIGRASCRERV